ncbi:MAG: hypothetical protein EOM06_15230 [Sphingobacteriia bacterium]|nr:hypothetical protein [Sphingobacteriia bacterium]
MKKIAFENRSAQAEAHRQFEAGAPVINAVISEWNTLDVGTITDEILNDLLRGYDTPKIVKASLRDSLRPEDLKLSGRLISRERMAELMTPPDLSALQEAVEVAAVHTEAFTLGSVQNGKFQIDKKKVEEMKRSNQVLTDDTKTLSAVQQIIGGLQVLLDTGKIDKGMMRWLVKARLIDAFQADGLQPHRSLFIQN